MNKMILNRVAIWQPKTLDKLTKRISPPGRAYFENNINKVSAKELIRYAKNYKIGKGKNAVKICLFLMTESDSEKEIETFLDKTAEQIDSGLAQKVVITSTMSNFEYLDYYYKENK